MKIQTVNRSELGDTWDPQDHVHNHETRIIKPWGSGCRACNRYHVKNTSKRVLITGSRDWDRPEVIAYALGIALGQLGPFILVHGDARGADRMAAELHESYGFTSEPHPANWESLGKRAGFVRNAEMVDLGADLCLAFIKNNSKGASMCADLAEKAGIPTRRYRA